VDTLAGSRRLLLTVLLLASCAPPLPEAVGSSHGAPVAARALDAGAPDGPARAYLPPDFRAWPRVNRARFLSLGHAGGRYDADVFASEPDGGGGERFVEEMFERGTTRPGPTYMMERLAPSADADTPPWRYVVVGPHGELVKEGPIESCAGCHREAPHDGVFRVE
jgi:hypothetical protein